MKMTSTAKMTMSITKMTTSITKMTTSITKMMKSIMKTTMRKIMTGTMNTRMIVIPM